jgi:hypothetical protein
LKGTIVSNPKRRVGILAAAVALAITSQGLVPAAATSRHRPTLHQLLSRADEAMKKAGTAKASGASTAKVTTIVKKQKVSRTDTGTFSGAGSTTGNAGMSRIIESLKTVSKTNNASTVLSYNTTAATIAFHVKKHKGWKCGDTAKVLNSIDVWTPNDFQLVTSHVPKGETAKITSGSWSGHAVWVLTLTGSQTKKGATEKTVWHSDIFKTSYRLVHVVWTTSATGKKGQFHESSWATLSHFGTALNPKMHGCMPKTA